MTTPDSAVPRPRAIRQAWAVLRKEIVDHVRDKRSLILALVYPLFGPVLIGALIFLSLQTPDQASDPRPVAGIVNAAAAPELVAFLQDNGVSLYRVTDNARMTVQEGLVPVVLAFARPGAPTAPLQVQLIVADSGRAGALAAAQIRTLLAEYRLAATADRLAAQGLSRNLVAPMELRTESVSDRFDATRFFYRLIPPLLLFTIFLGAVYVAVDATAGERERGSWEPLLTAPVHPSALLIGKAGAVLGFTVFAVILSLGGFYLVPWLLASLGDLPVTPPPGPALLLIFLIALPLMALAVIVQMAIGTAARSMKEAQLYLGLIPILPALAGMTMAFAPIDHHGWNTGLPVIGHMTLFLRLVSGEAVALGDLVTSLSATVVLTFVCFVLVKRLLRRETVSASG